MCGQYYSLANLDTNEYIDPWTAGSGAKLWELCMNDVTKLLPYLLAQGANGSGGDPHVPWGPFGTEDDEVDWEAYYDTLDDASANCGRWAGDRITVVGDYDESGLYQTVRDSGEWTEITPEIREEVLAFLVEGQGRERIHLGQDAAPSRNDDSDGGGGSDPDGDSEFDVSSVAMEVREIWPVSAIWTDGATRLEAVFHRVPDSLHEACPAGMEATQVSPHTVVFTASDEADHEHGDGDGNGGGR